MTKQEIRIQTRIIHELSYFMMTYGYTSFSITVENNQEETHFLLKMDHIKDELLNRMKEKLNRQREIEVETYGFELVGDHDSRSEFEILSLLIDYMEVERTEDAVNLLLVRKSMYRK